MQVDIHRNSVLEVPARFEDVASVKIYDNRGNLLVIALTHGGAQVVVTADDPQFESFCAQYGIRATKAETITA